MTKAMLAMRVAARPCAMAVLILLLGWVMGSQHQMGRLDPALVIPWMMPVLMWQAWRLRDAGRRRWLCEAALTLTALMGAQLILVAGAGAAAGIILPQLAVVLLAFAACMAASRALLRPMRWNLPLRCCIGIAASAVWLMTSHLILSWAYAPQVAGQQARPAVMVTGLPLRWSGSVNFADILSGQSSDDIFLTEIERLGPISLVDSLAEQPRNSGATWVLAHPLALTPQDMAAVDQHVRGGGRALIFADALSSWPAAHGFGDPRNAPITSLLTPLLDHWGVELAAVPHGHGGERWVRLPDAGLRLHSAGRFTRWPKGCAALGDAYILRCQIGQGQAVLVGDADLLFAPMWQSEGWDAAHLRKSDALPWTAQQIWGGDAGRRWLQPIWMKAPPAAVLDNH
jgi:hypothetical protein